MKKSANEMNDVNQLMIDELNLAVESIDAKTSDALKTARKKALATHVPAKPLFSFINTRMTTALASVAGVAMIVALLYQPTNTTSEISFTANPVTDSTEALENLPILFAPDELEFFQSVDFLVWMEKNTG